MKNDNTAGKTAQRDGQKDENATAGIIISTMIYDVPKRRFNRHGTLMKKKSGLLIARWKVGDKTFYKSTGTHDPRKALQILDKYTAPYWQDEEEAMIKSLQNQIAILEGQRTKAKQEEIPLESLWEVYYDLRWARENAESREKDSTISLYKSGFGKMTEWMKRHGVRYASGITVELAERFLDSEKMGDSKNKGIGANAFNNRLVFLKRVWRDLMAKNKYMLVDAWSGFQKIKGVKNDSARRELTKDEIGKLLAATSGDADMRLFLLLGLYTGLRTSDNCNLKWANVDFESHALTNVKLIKTKNDVTIPLHPELEKALLAAKETATGEYVSESNRHFYNTGHMRDKVKALFDKCGIETSKRNDEGKLKIETGAHALRHTFASWAINKAKMSPLLVQQILGHKKLEMTMRYYHGDMDAMREGISKLKVA